MVAWGDTLLFVATGGDGDEPANLLSFSLDPRAPSGASIDAHSGQFSWTPPDGYPVGVYSVTVRVRDDGSPPLEDATTFSVTVEEFNKPPVLDPIADQTVVVGTPFSLLATASDLTDPEDSLRFSLGAGAPVDMSIGARTGLRRWTPSAEQASGWYEIDVRVSDPRFPAKEDVQTFGIRLFGLSPSGQVDWGSVDFLEIPAQSLIDGDRFVIRPFRSGRLTIEALFANAGGDVDLTLLDPGGAVVGSSIGGSDNERIDAVVVGSDMYELVIVGSNPAVAFRVANLLVDEADRLGVYGTSGDDVFELVLGSEHQLTVKGVAYSINAATVSTIVVDGLSGSDQITLTGTGSDETVELWPSTAQFDGAAASVQVSAVGTISVDGGGGSDTATFRDSSGNDSFVAMPDYGKLRGNGFENVATSFGEVYAYSTGGSDVAQMYDSPGTDSFVATPDYAQLKGDGFLLRADSFATVQANASNGGTDVAQLFDSASDDSFLATPVQGALYGEGYYNRARLFDTVHANATAGGYDTALMYDSPGNDDFIGSPIQGVLYGEGFYNRAKMFDTVHAYAQSGGHDTAQLYDSAGDDVFEAMPTESTLFGDGFFNRVKSFDEVRAYAQLGGYDTADLYDAGSDDTLDATPTEVQLQGSKFFSRAKYFDAVYAHATGGGFDTANLHDSTGNDTFEGEPGLASLSGDAFYNLVEYFERVYTWSSPGGFDQAYLHDSPSTDYLDAELERTTFSDARLSFFFWLADYEYIKVTSEHGPDRKTIAAAVDFLVLEGQWLDL